MTFPEFARERTGGLLRYATALCLDADLAEDIVQEVLLRVSQHWSRISALAQPGAYVKRMVTNEYLSLRRRRSVREVAAHAVPEHYEQPMDDPAPHYDERAAALSMIATLPPKQRAVVVLRYYENLSDTEIAAELGCGASTVRTHLQRALSALRIEQSRHADENACPARLLGDA